MNTPRRVVVTRGRHNDLSRYRVPNADRFFSFTGHLKKKKPRFTPHVPYPQQYNMSVKSLKI